MRHNIKRKDPKGDAVSGGGDDPWQRRNDFLLQRASDQQVTQGIEDKASDRVQQMCQSRWAGSKDSLNRLASKANRGQFRVSEKWAKPLTKSVKSDCSKRASSENGENRIFHVEGSF